MAVLAKPPRTIGNDREFHRDFFRESLQARIEFSQRQGYRTADMSLCEHLPAADIHKKRAARIKDLLGCRRVRYFKIHPQLSRRGVGRDDPLPGIPLPHQGNAAGRNTVNYQREPDGRTQQKYDFFDHIWHA